jgi:translation initiation factor 2 subunit 1
MSKRRGYPQLGELVVCKIINLNPNSAFAKLDEYDLEGIIHISEITSGWVRDIREHLKKDQIIIAKVVRVDKSSGRLSLSIRRVDSNQEKEKMKEYKFSQKAEKMLELVAGDMGKTLKEAYEEVGFKIQETFGSLHDGFKETLKNPQKLIDRGIPEEWVNNIKKIAEKSMEQKEFVFRSRFNVRTHEKGGIDKIKTLLLEAEKMGLEVRYISSPEYLIRYKTKNAKKGEKDFEEKLNKLASTKDVEASFSILKP